MYESNYDGSGVSAIFWIVLLAVYFYFAWTQYRIAQKVGCSDKAWWSFVPILNTFLLISMAGKEWYWFLFCLIPLVNIVAWAILWIEVAKTSGNSPFWGVMVLLPFVNFVALGVMAFSGSSQGSSFPTSGQLNTHEPTHVG